MRKLVFGTEKQDKDTFSILYTGFLLGAPEGGLKGIAQNRIAMKIVDKLEVVAKKDSDYTEGDQRPFGPTGEPMLELNGGGQILLETTEYEMLKRHVENAPWLPGAARRVVAAMEFLEAAPEVNVAEKAPAEGE